MKLKLNLSKIVILKILSFYAVRRRVPWFWIYVKTLIFKFDLLEAQMMTLKISSRAEFLSKSIELTHLKSS